MTQKQTDYDKAVRETKARINDERGRWNIEEAIEYAFSQSYECGKKQSTESDNLSQNVANCDVDHFRDSTKMVRYEIAKECAKALLHNPRGFDDFDVVAYNAVGYADALIKELGNNL